MLELQEDYLADDLKWPRDAESWTEAEAHAFFDSGGLRVPDAGGADQATGAAAAASSSVAAAEPGAYLAPVCYEVTHSHVNVRSTPSIAGANNGMMRRGATVLASSRQGAWIKLSGADGGWMMVDGLEAKMGQLMRVHATPAPPDTSWQITRAGGCAAHAEAGGGEPAGWLEEAATVDVIAESGGWVQVAMSWSGGSEAWIELDSCLAG